MVRWHHRLDGHGSEQSLGDSEGRGSLARCSLWGHKVSRDDLCTSVFAETAQGAGGFETK